MQSTPWAEGDPMDKPDFSLAPTWDEDEEDGPKKGINLFRVSENQKQSERSTGRSESG